MINTDSMNEFAPTSIKDNYVGDDDDDNDNDDRTRLRTRHLATIHMAEA